MEKSVASATGRLAIHPRCFSHQRCSIAQRVRKLRICVRSGEDANVDRMKAMQEAMKNPELMKTVQERMNQPEVQQQMAQMQSMMQNQAFMAKAAALKDDPELKPMFDEIKTGGMGAMMKYMNDPQFLAKIGEKMGDIPEAAAPEPQAALQPPEINTILDAARYGDLEALEDFIAIGKGDEKDDNGRSALHYAVAYDQGPAAGVLIEQGADVNAQDSTGNTPLHFAAGYGRLQAVQALISVGADVTIANSDGKTARDVVTDQPKNPLNSHDEIMEKLK